MTLKLHGCLVLVVVVVLSAKPSVAQIECEEKLDLMFVVDGSNSIYETNFEQIINMVLSSLRNFTLGADQTRIGVVIYGTGRLPTLVYPLSSDINSLTATLQANTLIPDGPTDTDKGLLEARLVLTGGSARTTVPKVMLLLTDGDSDYPDRVNNELESVKKDDISIVAVAAGLYANKDNLVPLVEDPSSDLFELKDFQQAIRRVLGKAQTTCIDCEQGMDLMFVLDGSNSVGYENFVRTLRAIRNASSFLWGDYSNARLGFLTYGSIVDNRSIILPTDVDTAFDNLERLEYPDSGTNTAAALTIATAILEDNKRSGMPRVIVIITNGVSNDRGATQLAEDAAKRLGIIIYAIGVGANINEEELAMISSRRADIVSNFIQLSTQLTSLVRTVCTPRDLTQACFRALDVIFVLDSSTGVSSTNFNTMTSAVSSTAAYVMAGMNSRVGLITYGSTLQNQPLTFDESVVNAIGNLQYLGGTRDTARALQQAGAEVSSRRRPMVPMDVILLIAGPSDNPGAAAANGQSLVGQDGASGVYVLEITDAVNRVETLGIASNMDNKVYRANSFSQVADQLSNMIQSVCLAR